MLIDGLPKLLVSLIILSLTDTVISEDFWSENLSVKNTFIWSIPELLSNLTRLYWVAPANAQGEFILEFDQPRVVSVIILVNTHNGDWNNMGTKEFKVSIFKKKTLSLTETQQNSFIHFKEEKIFIDQCQVPIFLTIFYI